MQPLFGTQVTLFGGYDPDVVAALRDELEAFTDAHRDRGSSRGEPGVRRLRRPTASPPATRPTSPSFPSAGRGRLRLRTDGNLIDIGTYLDIPELKENQSPYLVSLGTVGEDGTWPAPEGSTYGAFVNVNLKGLIWYPVPEFARRRVHDPSVLGRDSSR